MINQKILLTEYKLNSLFNLKNRMVMAPMTRAKASDGFLPTSAMADYYAKRADAGLIVTEGTVILPDAIGHQNVPGIFNDAQVRQWKEVADKVHQNNGIIFMQLWHVGRVSHPDLLQGKLPISASATQMTGKISRSDGLTFGYSRAANLLEIVALIDAYANAAENAIAAGFDGVEIHGANGYLIDQFLHYDTNHRQDIYGGTPENMSRFALQIVKAIGERIGYERVGIRLSPGAYLNQIKGDTRDAFVFGYLLEQLNSMPIAYVHTGNFNDTQTFPELNNMSMTTFMRTYYHGTLIGCGSYTIATAEKAILSEDVDLIAFGRPFISNPDFVNVAQQDLVMKPYDVSMLATLE